MRDGAFNESAPLKLTPEEPKLSTVFRKNDTYAVWDERGLTIRFKDQIRSSKLTAIVTSPKAFSREEIQKNQREIRAGRRSKDVAALSGALRVANKVYFLCRWEDNKKKPWVEAMVEVNLDDKPPIPKFLARISALSMSTEPIDSQLFVLDGKVTHVARKETTWGLQQLDPPTGRFTFDEVGAELESYSPLTGKGRRGLFVEKTEYGTTIAGRIDLQTRNRRILAEARAKMRFIDAADPSCIILSFGNRASIVNADTGAIYDFVAPSSTRRTNRGIVIWTPVENPKRAWLFDPARWEVRAWWNAELSKPDG